MALVDVCARDRKTGEVIVIHNYATKAKAANLIALITGKVIELGDGRSLTDYELFTRDCDEDSVQWALV